MRGFGSRLATIGLLATLSVGFLACGQKSDAELRTQFRSEPWEASRYIAKENALRGYTKAQVAAVLGSDGTKGAMDPTEGTWGNNCSGREECYTLVLYYDSAGKVKSADRISGG